MKANKIYLIKTLSEPIDETEVDKMLDDVSECFDVDDDENFIVEDIDGRDYLFLRLDYYKVERICKVLDRYIKYEIEEITDKLILGNEGDLKDIIKCDDFKKFFDNFRIDNTVVDDVLDKINHNGIESLDDIDKQVLQRG